MTMIDKDEILDSIKSWFSEVIIPNHIKNTKKLIAPSEFTINPLTTNYLANFLFGHSSPENIAKALLYPRVLGSSINTSFGQNFQSFITDALGAFGSTTSGIDIEFQDQIDGRHKYCQLKLGPTTINKDDVTTIVGHFKAARNLGRTNNIQLSFDQLIVGVIYGEESELSANYKSIRDNHDYPVIIGNDFWKRLTGFDNFLTDISNVIAQLAVEINFSNEFEEIISELARSEVVQKISNHE